MANATTPISRIKVTRDMLGLTSRADTPPLTGLSDAIGLTRDLVVSLAVHSRSVRHEPGRIVRDIAVMIADGGDCSPIWVSFATKWQVVSRAVISGGIVEPVAGSGCERSFRTSSSLSCGTKSIRTSPRRLLRH